MAVRIERTEEWLVAPAVQQQIAALLGEAFPDYPAGQSYYKQLPHFRLLAWHESRLVGHLAVEHRLISNSGAPLRIFGIADLCVAADHQHRKIASCLLLELETLGRVNGIDFLVLLAKDHDLYLHNGFQAVDNLCQWVMVQRFRTFGVVRRSLGGSLLIKPLGDKTWKNGLVDFLGHIF